MVLQATLTWAINGGGVGKTALHFKDDTVYGNISARFIAFRDLITAYLANSTGIKLEAEVKKFNTATGTLEAIGSLIPPTAGVGSGGPSPVPNASQGLIRFNTLEVVNGRFVKGRLFVPGLSTTNVSGSGELNTTAVTALTTAGTALCSTGELVVWHRPKNGAGGQAIEVNTAGAWNELAVQRRRRS